MGFYRQEYRSGLPFPSPGESSLQELNLHLLHCRQILYLWAIVENKKVKKEEDWCVYYLDATEDVHPLNHSAYLCKGIYFPFLLFPCGEKFLLSQPCPLLPLLTVAHSKRRTWFNWQCGRRNWGFLGGSDCKATACNAGDLSSIPGSGRSPREANGNPFQYSCLENSMDGGAW